jgi:hypothetical protein
MVVEADQIKAVWDDPNPNLAVQKLLVDFIKELGFSKGQDYMAWDEFEVRYTNNELKWIADYLVNCLVFIKTNLKVEKHEAVVLHLFWTTLDLFSHQDGIEKAIESRYDILQAGISKLFTEGVLNKESAR